jgi:hypothetical protein
MMSSALAELRGYEEDATHRLRVVRAALAEKNAATRELPALEKRAAALRNGAPYRSDDLVSLQAKLDEARAARIERASLRIQEADLLHETEQIRIGLEANGVRKVTLPVLENVYVASPCDASWADMQGDTDVRFCTSCSKHVYNLSMMSREEGEAVLRAGTGNDLCVRLFRRTDGTVITDDCPVGLQRRRFWQRTRGIAAGGMIAAALGALTYERFVNTVRCDTRSHTSGAVANLAPG